MPVGQKHIIQKSCLNLKIQNKENAYDIQSRFLETFKKVVLPEMEKVFNRLSPSGELIRLDRLELNLGNLALKDLESEMLVQVLEKLQSELSKKIASISADGSDSRIGIGERKIQEFEQFLRTGNLAWSSQLKSFNPEEELLSLMEKESVALRKILLNLAELPGPRKRLVLQFSEKAHLELIHFLAPAMADKLIAWATEVEKFNAKFQLLKANLQPRTFLIREFSLAMAFMKARPALKPKISNGLGIVSIVDFKQLKNWSKNSAIFLNQFLSFSLRREGQKEESLEDTIRMLSSQKQMDLFSHLFKTNSKNFIDELTNLIQSNLKSKPQVRGNKPLSSALLFCRSIARELLSTNPVQNQEEFLISFSESFGEANLVNQVKQSLGLKIQAGKKVKNDRPNIEKSSEKPLVKSTLEEALYVNNAGLVLLNPFFQTCFSGFNWLENGEFKSEIARENAVMFLAWMVSGKKDICEAELPLIKLVCGMDLEFPVRSEVDLPDETLGESDELLKAAIGYWDKLGNLKPSEFRNSFLQREGRLLEKGGGFNVKIERKSIDVLLEFLPWSYGIVRLPWMSKVLTVDW